ncbi:MAG: hypothetical protein ACXW2P_12665, partial [Thermoanaerobaculia bacterium]
MNTRFQYVYRDGSNYKQWGRVSFRGACDAALLGRLFSALDSDSLFVAHQVRLPDLFFNDGRLYADDHCFHEIVDVSATEEPPDDLLERTIGEFVEEMERASRRGWDVFDVWT